MNKSTPNLLIAIVLLLGFASCNWEGPEPDCGPNGEFIEGDCFCEAGWEGANCDTWIIERIVGDYTFSGITVDSARTHLVFGDIRIFANSPTDKVFYLEAAQMRDPIACQLPGRRYYEAFIDWQENVYTDTAGIESTISLMGDFQYDYVDGFAMDFESHGCKLRYDKQ